MDAVVAGRDSSALLIGFIGINIVCSHYNLSGNCVDGTVSSGQTEKKEKKVTR